MKKKTSFSSVPGLILGSIALKKLKELAKRCSDLHVFVK